jgi:diaminopimelate decarboxylase
VAQCGSLITKVLYVKKNSIKNFVIIDAGMTDLLRPALYNSYHKIENLSSKINKQRYDIVGPICESSDFLGKDVLLSEVQRGDYLEVKSVGAYGESMALSYNLRNKTKARFF